LEEVHLQAAKTMTRRNYGTCIPVTVWRIA
jgi:hypothetical protein